MISRLINNAEALLSDLESGVLVRDVLEDYGEEIMSLQRIQLLEGKASSGNDIRPYYSEDVGPTGYFKTKADADKYRVWKGSLSYPHDVQRNDDAPNLYINGKFHSELGVTFGPQALAILPETPYASKIVRKYGVETFGLTREKWNELFVERGVLEKIMANVKNRLYGN